MDNRRTQTAGAGASAPVAVSNVIPIRPRAEVPRSIQTVRTLPPQLDFGDARLHIDGRVIVGDLFGALATRGLSIAYDKRTGDFRVMRGEDAAKERQP